MSDNKKKYPNTSDYIADAQYALQRCNSVDMKRAIASDLQITLICRITRQVQELDLFKLNLVDLGMIAKLLDQIEEIAI